MAKLGYHLSSEEHDATTLVANARLAEEAGFDFACISDHFHPWLERQGHAPFVWTVLGGIAQATTRMEVGTAVTCPIMRIHPAIIAQAAATTATMLPGRFFLGVGTGEWLNEHVVGRHWPTASVRMDMLEEAVDVIRQLWRGKLTSHHGEHFTVENAQIYDVPDAPPPIFVAASGDQSAELAGRIGDGLIALSPTGDLVETFEGASKDSVPRPRIGMTHVCVAPSEDEALETVRRWWANTGVPGALNAELPLPRHFEAAAEAIPDDQLAEKVPMGDDPKVYAEALGAYIDAGFDRVLVHQIGPDQERFIRFFTDEVRPLLG